MTMQQTVHHLTITNVYQQNRYRPVDRARVSWREQRLLEDLLTSHGLRGRVGLDAPCGYDRLLPLYSRLSMMMTGLDLSQDRVQLASGHPTPMIKGGVISGSICELPFADETFDIAICTRLLPHPFHYANRHRLFTELARVSRRYMLVSYYHLDPLQTWLGRSRWPRKGRLPPILNETDLDVLIWANGLNVLSTHAMRRSRHTQTFVMLEK